MHCYLSFQLACQHDTGNKPWALLADYQPEDWPAILILVLYVPHHCLRNIQRLGKPLGVGQNCTNAPLFCGLQFEVACLYKAEQNRLPARHPSHRVALHLQNTPREVGKVPVIQDSRDDLIGPSCQAHPIYCGQKGLSDAPYVCEA